MSENKEKGIIIDDIDVSTCHNITVTRFIVCECGVQGVDYYNMMCSDNPDCYYKQLQREKLKNEKLAEDFNEIFKRHNEAFEDFNKLKLENKTLKKELELLNSGYFETLITNLEITYNNIEMDLQNLKKDVNMQKKDIEYVSNLIFKDRDVD